MHGAGGVGVQQRRAHLRAAGVVHAHEQHLGDGLHDGSFGLGQSDQPLGVTWLVSDTRWVLIFAVRRSAVSDSNT